MGKRQTLTPATIETLTIGKLADAATPGLWIEVRKSGKKTWLYRRRVAECGTAVKRTLGPFPAYTIAVARKWATGINEQIEAGVDPRELERNDATSHERLPTRSSSIIVILRPSWLTRSFMMMSS
jgi:hypothetical protein